MECFSFLRKADLIGVSLTFILSSIGGHIDFEEQARVWFQLAPIAILLMSYRIIKISIIARDKDEC